MLWFRSTSALSADIMRIKVRKILTSTLGSPRKNYIAGSDHAGCEPPGRWPPDRSVPSITAAIAKPSRIGTPTSSATDALRSAAAKVVTRKANGEDGLWIPRTAGLGYDYQPTHWKASHCSPRTTNTPFNARGKIVFSQLPPCPAVVTMRREGVDLFGFDLAGGWHWG